MDKSRTMNERIAVAESQMARLASDAESEKVARHRVDAVIDRKFETMRDEIRILEVRVRHLERGMYTAMGALAFMQVIFQLWNHHAFA
jgi:hypothetical protein